MHLDLGVERLDAEVDRIERIGARRISEERAEHQFRWVLFADPEGNEFCVYVQGNVQR